jgi:putative nucleotidyltransferase with HDIG domain
MIDSLIASAREAQLRGAWDEALAGFATALAVLTDGGDAVTRADVLRMIGTVHRDRGDLEGAREHYATSRDVASAAGRRDREAKALNALGVVEMRLGARERAAELLREARELGEAAGDERLVAMVDQNLGVLANIEGRVGAALRSYRSALEHYRRLGDEHTACGALVNMGMAHVDLSEWEAAERCFAEASEMAERLGDAMHIGLVELNRTELHLRRGLFEEARESCDRSLHVFHRLRSKPAIGEAYKYQGMLYRETGRPEQADTHFALALGLAETSQDRLLQAEAQLEWAVLHLAQDRTQEGILRLNRALGIFRDLEARREVLDVEQRLERLRERYLPAVQQWGASSTEGRDPHQVGHSDRVSRYSTRLAQRLGLADDDVAWVRLGALVHDIGNIAVPLEVFRKPSALTGDERQIVRVHTIMGDALAAQLDFPDEVRPMVRSHHEHWEGTGYPDGLHGEQIPVAARIVAVSEVYDALTSPRSFRPAYPAAEAMRLMERECWGMFDPRVFGAFRSMLEDGSDPPPAAA